MWSKEITCIYTSSFWTYSSFRGSSSWHEAALLCTVLLLIFIYVHETKQQGCKKKQKTRLLPLIKKLQGTFNQHDSVCRWTMFYFRLPGPLSLFVEWLFTDHSALCKWFGWSSVFDFLACTHSLLFSHWFHWRIHLLFELWRPPVQTSSIRCFPDITSAARFLSVWQAKEVEWKNCSPTHCGHMAREESSRSGARRPQSGIFVVSFLLCCSLSRCAARPASALCCSLAAMFSSVSHELKSKNWSQEQPEKIHFLLTHYARCLPSQTIYTDGVTHEKESPRFAGMEGKDLATSAEWFTAARHTLARMNDFHPLARSHSDTRTQWNQGKGEHAHVNTYILNNGNICFTKPAQPWLTWGSHHLFLCSGLTVKSDGDSLLPLSLVSLSRNRTRRAGDPQMSSGNLIWNLSSTGWWRCAYVCMVILDVVRVGVLTFWCSTECVVVPGEQSWKSASLCKSWPCKNNTLYVHLNRSAHGVTTAGSPPATPTNTSVALTPMLFVSVSWRDLSPFCK